jgi:hypothetical protein
MRKSPDNFDRYGFDVTKHDEFSDDEFSDEENMGLLILGLKGLSIPQFTNKPPVKANNLVKPKVVRNTRPAFFSPIVSINKNNFPSQVCSADVVKTSKTIDSQITFETGVAVDQKTEASRLNAERGNMYYFSSNGVMLQRPSLPSLRKGSDNKQKPNETSFGRKSLGGLFPNSAVKTPNTANKRENNGVIADQKTSLIFRSVAPSPLLGRKRKNFEGEKIEALVYKNQKTVAAASFIAR